MPPKSILKKPAAGASRDRDAQRERHMATALHHANLIQQQKDAEKLIIDSVLALLDLPSRSDANPAHPSEEDAAEFKRLIYAFQPGDYDELIEERNAADLCGYVLCPRPPARDGAGGKYKIVCSAEHGLKILPRSKVELWCSQDCAKRALYIKVQLSEEPAAVRRAGLSEQIELWHEQNFEQVPTVLPLRLKPTTSAVGKTGLEDNVAKLTVENVDAAGDAENKLIKPNVVEKLIRTTPIPPQLLDGEAAHSKIEGHVVRDLSSKHRESQSDDEDRDWDV